MSSPPPSVWPGPPSGGGTVVPFPLPWGQTGCCPPGGMDALMKCYCDIQAATAFICKVMVDCIEQNPAVIEAIIAGLQASGSNLPLIGVTNGSNAQPGQVGEYIRFQTTVNYPQPNNSQIVSAGILQPGDWDLTAWWAPLNWSGGTVFQPSPVPAGLLPGSLFGAGDVSGQAGLDGSTVVSATAQGNFSVPTLLTFQVITNASGSPDSPAGTGEFYVDCRRAR